MKYTKEERNEIYWKTYEIVYEQDWFGSEFICCSLTLALVMLDLPTSINDCRDFPELHDLSPKGWDFSSPFFDDGTTIPDYEQVEIRLTIIGFMIAMTDD